MIRKIKKVCYHHAQNSNRGKVVNSQSTPQRWAVGISQKKALARQPSSKTNRWLTNPTILQVLHVLPFLLHDPTTIMCILATMVIGEITSTMGSRQKSQLSIEGLNFLFLFVGKKNNCEKIMVLQAQHLGPSLATLASLEPCGNRPKQEE